MVPVAAEVGGVKSAGVAAASDQKVTTIGLESLVDLLEDRVRLPNRTGEGNLLFAMDHCFNIRGKGTVLTGTVLRGSVKVGRD